LEYQNGPFTEKLKSMVLNHNNVSPIKVIVTLLLITYIVTLNGCKVTYSFSGASISPQVKTISVQYFQNRASLVQPGLSQSLTDALIDKCKAQTNLAIVNGAGDVNFEGEISNYSTQPLSIAADAQAAQNRFTIQVKVKFTNSIDPELNFEQTFARYEDYDSALDLSSVEADLSKKIIDLIVEDIFNQAFVNW
jgi:hypothetical protein